MDKTALPLLIVLIALTGCAQHYVLRLNNGMAITSANKPKLKDGIYQYKDAKGEDHFISVARVREVAPASTVAREDKTQPLKSDQPKKRHWYFLWLA